MKKRTIGNIQIVFGVIILLIGIGSIIYAFNSLDELVTQGVIMGNFEEAQEGNPNNYSNDTLMLMKIEISNFEFNYNLSIINWLTILFTTSIISIILSLMFILQGLANISETRKSI